jgi:hypothetical protein
MRLPLVLGVVGIVQFTQFLIAAIMAPLTISMPTPT